MLSRAARTADGVLHGLVSVARRRDFRRRPAHGYDRAHRTIQPCPSGGANDCQSGPIPRAREPRAAFRTNKRTRARDRRRERKISLDLYLLGTHSALDEAEA